MSQNKLQRMVGRSLIALAVGMGLLAIVSVRATTVEASATPGVDANFYKITTTQTGMIKVTYETLAAAGLPVTNINPTTFQLFEQGSEIPRRVVDADSSGSYNAGDYFLFYGRAVNTYFTGANVYWLTYGVGPGRDMSTRDATPNVSLPPVSAYLETLHVEQNKVWRGDVPLTGNADRWYWQLYDATCRPTCVQFNFSNTQPLANLASGSYTATLTPRLRGYSTRTHLALFYMNGASIGQATFNWQDEYFGSLSFNQGLLINGNNILTFTVPLDAQSTRDSGLLNWFDLNYYRTFNAPVSGQFAFKVNATGPVSVTLTGIADSATAIYDVTDPANPTLLTGAQLDGIGPFSLTFAHQLTTTAPYIAAGPSQYLTPGTITLDTPSNLRNTSQGADWMIIAYKDFLPAAEQLAAHRRTLPNFRATVIDVQDIYDEFNGGLTDQEAIRSFVRYAYENWQRPAPAYVVLLGDGHYDPRDYSLFHTGSYIPPYLAAVNGLDGMIAADNRYVAYEPAALIPNPTPFMSLGRLPANTLAEAQAMVNKIIEYETTPPDLTWNRKTIFVADKYDPAAGDFMASSNEIANGTNHLPAEYDRLKLYYESDPAHATTETVGLPASIVNGMIAAINSGAFLATYNGHSGVQAWGSQELWSTNYLSQLNNKGKYVIMLPMTCLEGSFTSPRSVYPALGESVVRLADAGAVASWSPTGKGLSVGHDLISAAFYDAIFKEGIPQIGPATDYAKRYLAGWQDPVTHLPSPSRDLIDTYILFGDPAMSFQLPGPDLQVQQVMQPSGVMIPGSQGRYVITYRNIGTAPAAGVVLTDTLPAELGNPNWSASDLSVTILAGQGLGWQLPDLAPGASGSITVTFTVSASLPANVTVTNGASISTASWESPLKLANNVSSVANLTVQPTGFNLESFTARWRPTGAHIEWVVRNENGILGYNLYRTREPGGPEALITPEPILPSAPPDEAWTYGWDDLETLPGKWPATHYRLEILLTTLPISTAPIPVEWASRQYLPIARRGGVK